LCLTGCKLVLFANKKLLTGFLLVLTSATLNGVMTTNACFVIAELVHVMPKKVPTARLPDGMIEACCLVFGTTCMCLDEIFKWVVLAAFSLKL